MNPRPKKGPADAGSVEPGKNKMRRRIILEAPPPKQDYWKWLTETAYGQRYIAACERMART